MIFVRNSSIFEATLTRFLFMPQPEKTRQIMVSSALPYANGPLHAGHILEHTQTDIWVRFQRLRGHICTYIAADDGHGTTTMLKAKELGLTPEALLKQVQQDHISDFQSFHISHDNYCSTHSEENRILSEYIYQRCKEQGYISTRQVEQLYDPDQGLFLADRFVSGSCPKCKAEDQYGDNCEVCGASYHATELIEPRSKLSGSKPILKTSEHYFFDLPAFTDFLKQWIAGDAVHSSIKNKLNEWLISGLAQWDISRDSPYFGFRIPDTKDKYFYVWMDAPIGYMASFQNLTEHTQHLNFDDYWDAQAAATASTEVHHFIGKDIIYFHALFWPAMLKCSGFRTPTRIHTHGFLTINQSKMSKSRHVSFDIKSYLRHFDPEYLRYYFASRLTPGVDDIDMDMQELSQKVNSDLVGKLINIASRCSRFLNQQFDSMLSAELPDPAGLQHCVDAAKTIAKNFEEADFARGVREIMALADLANGYIQAQEPWALARQGPAEIAKVQGICTQGLNLFRILMLYIKPITPKLAERAEAFLHIEPLRWTDLDKPLLNHRIGQFEPLMERLDHKALQKLMMQGPAEPKKTEEGVSTIQYGQFSEIQLKIARIAQAKEVENADTLLQLTMDVGGDSTKTVFAGIKAAYKPDDLVGRLTLMVTNLAPKKMRFGVSEGMLLAAGPGGKEIFLLSPDTGATPGMTVK